MMQEIDHFNVQLFRQYPHLYKSVLCLVREYTAAFEKIKQLDLCNGDLEIEAMFGRVYITDSRRFDHALPVDIMNKLLTILLSFKEWDGISDWYIVYDYYACDKSRIRVSYENKHQKVTRVKKWSLSHTDFSYKEAKTDWKLRDYALRVNMKYEQAVENNIEEMVEFTSVKLSTRKYFVCRSKSIPQISFRFELIQYWTGGTVKIAEQKMKTETPLCSLECEIVNIPSQNTFSNVEKSLLFTSLLLKMQDFFDIPVYTRHIQNKENTQVDVPTFEQI